MDPGDGGAEEDNRERQSGNGRQNSLTEEPGATGSEALVPGETNFKEANSAEVGGQAGLESNDTEDGNLSGTQQDKDGDLCLQGREEMDGSAKSSNDKEEEKGNHLVIATDKTESPRHVEGNAEEKCQKDAKVSLTAEEKDKCANIGKPVENDSPDSVILPESNDRGTEDSHGVDSHHLGDKQLQQTDGNEKSRDQDEPKTDKEDDGNVIEIEKSTESIDNPIDASSQQTPDPEPIGKKDSVNADTQMVSKAGDNQHISSLTSEDNTNQDKEQEKEGVEKLGEAPLLSGNELDDFFASSAMPENPHIALGSILGSHEQEKGRSGSAEGTPSGFFPALDNVDLETDEEILDGEKVANLTEKTVEPKEGLEEAESKVERITPVGTGTIQQQLGVAQTVNSADWRAERPFSKSPIVCQDNYQVCRELQPGIKECLILETGEQFICVNPPHEEQGMAHFVDEAEKPVYLVQRGEKSSSQKRNLKPDSPLPVEDDDDHAPLDVYRTTHPTMLRVDNVLTPSEAFAYVSFDDDGSGDGQGSFNLKCSNHTSPRKFLNGMQQGYISRNGIPIIMDNAEDEVYKSGKISKQSDQDWRSGNDVVYSGNVRAHELQSKFAREFLSSNLHSSSVMEKYREVDDDDSDGHFYLWGRKTTVQDTKQKEKDGSEEFIELAPDDTDNSDGGSGIGTLARGESGTFHKAGVEIDNLRLNLNNNNDGRGDDDDDDDEMEGPTITDENNSANGRGSQKVRRSKDRNKSEPPSRPKHDPPSDYSSSSYKLRPDSHVYSSHKHSPSRSSYLHDSTDYQNRHSSSRYRSGDYSSVDSSRLSTRFRHLDRGDTQSSASRHESSTVPRFNTLHDQQVSWLDMFKMIEAQHRTELRSQHEEHERLLREMQHNMARELSRQQDTLKHSLSAHREILEELSPGRHRDSRQNKNQSRKFDDVEGSSEDSQKSAESQTGHSSHTTLQGVDVSLKNPPPFSRYSDVYDSRDPSDLPVKRSLESELSSPSRPADTSLSQSRISMGSDKQLRGGVYSSPMPLAKAKHKNSPRAHKSSSEGTVLSSPNDDKSRNANSARKHSSEKRQAHTERLVAASTDVSQADSEDFLSPRTRVNLREKHARHLADLRAYYEEELRDMRQMLQASQRKLDRAGGDGAQSQPQELSLQQPPGKSMEEKILEKENEELRQRCRELQDDYHDSKSEIRELQQKIQGLEIRATDYAQRYDQSQAQVLSLGSRLEELTEFAKEKEARSADLEAKNKRVAESLQMAYKKEKELTDSLHAAKTTIQRLVDKYEMLEKDYTILKESAAATQEKLLQSRHEAIETNNKLSRLEMDNKQLQHDNEILKHDLTMTRSSLSMRTSYEDSFSPSRGGDRGRANHNASTSVRTRSGERSQHNASPTPGSKSKPRHTSCEDRLISPSEDSLQSPILRAEEELRRLQGSVAGGAGSKSSEFAPKLQRKFYGTEVPSQTRASPTNRNRCSFSPNSSKTRSSLEKKGRSTTQGRDGGRGSKAGGSKLSFKAEPLNYITEREKTENMSNHRDKKSRDSLASDRDQSSSSRKPAFASNGMSGDVAMERIKAGDIVSRPEWEDMFTSMAPSRSTSNGVNTSSNRAATREQILQERVQNIDNLEKKYDKLVTQKRKYESSLSKLPVHGHRGEKERLEAELDQLDKELGSVRMSLKRFHVLKSTI